MTETEWEEFSLKDVCLKVEKTNKHKNPADQNFTYIDIASIDNEKFTVVSPKNYKWNEAPSRAQQIVKEGDTVFSTVRTYLKNIAFVHAELDGAIASTGFCIIRPNTAIVLPRLLFYFTLTNEFLGPLNAIQRGTSYPAVRDSDVMAQPIKLPALSEQLEILAKIEELFSEIEAATQNIEMSFGKVPRNIESLTRSLEQSILSKAFKGELV